MPDTEALLAHYVSMARDPGLKACAWHRVNEMARDYPWWFADFPQRLTAAMTVG